VTIRGKLYTAIVVGVAGLALTAGVGIWALSELSGRFDTAQRAADARALALQLQFDVTDFNGWQTAYGYDDGRSRPVFLRSVARFRQDLARARTTLTRPAEARPIARMQAGLAEFMRIDAEAWTALQAGAKDKVKRLFLGPEITNFERIAAAAQALAASEDAYAARQERAFRHAREHALRLLIAAAVIAAFLIAILLVTATDLARSAEKALARDMEAPGGPAPP
jgi:hypothetical protein